MTRWNPGSFRFEPDFYLYYLGRPPTRFYVVSNNGRARDWLQEQFDGVRVTGDARIMGWNMEFVEDIKKKMSDSKMTWEEE